MRFQTFKIITFGCRVNQSESRLIGEKLVNETMKQCDNEAIADIVVINTCCVTNKAEKEVRKEIRRVKRENQECFLVVVGCWVEVLRKAFDKINFYSVNKLALMTPANNICNQSKIKKLSAYKGRRRLAQTGVNTHKSYLSQHFSLSTQKNTFSLVDLWLGNKDKEKIGEILRKKIVINYARPDSGYSNYEDKYARFKKAMVKIQGGCDNFCTYCIVPYVRGRSKSRKVEDIVKEIKPLVKQGIEEVVLTGTDISDYKPSLVQLIKVVLQKTKIRKISFGSMGLKVFDEKFIEIYPCQRLSTHLHIPLQSGCNQTLKRMNRRYSVEEFIRVIKKLKKNIKGFTFSTDIIVGFPGETEKEFRQTLKTLKEIRKILGKKFTKIHIFRFSPKNGTLAEKMVGKKNWEKVGEKLKRKRSQKIKVFIK